LLYLFFGNAGVGISPAPAFLSPYVLAASGRKDKLMTNLPFERKSRVNTNSDNYLDANGNYVYTRMVRRSNGQWEREIIDIVPLTSENMDCIIFLEDNDHDMVLAERYDAESVDYDFLARKDADDGDPFDRLAVQIFDDAPERPDMEKVLAFIETLTPAQKDLVYAHLGERKFLEDIRREEETATGKKISKQAMHNRWNKIIAKACKYFGVEKPKQVHKKRG